MELSGLKLSDIHPSQFYISLEKLRQVEKWFRPDDLSHFEPVPVKRLNGRIIFTDGHTRALPLTGRAWQRFLLCGMRTSLTGKHTSFVRTLQQQGHTYDIRSAGQGCGCGCLPAFME